MSSKLSVVFPIGERYQQAEFRHFALVAGEPMIHRAWRSFAPYLHLIDKFYFFVLSEDEKSFNVSRRLKELFGDTAYQVVCLDYPTDGPAETVARGVAQCELKGPAIVCDADHWLDPRPLLQAIAAEPEIACQVCVWPIKGEDLRRWSVASVSKHDRVREVAERQLPASSGSFYGVVGCYHFREIERIAMRCLTFGLTRFSQLFNLAIRNGEEIAVARLHAAEFFGDAERIRDLETQRETFRGTVFCDIDGTIVAHEDKPSYTALPRILPGSREKLARWIADGYCVILCTARSSAEEPMLVAALRRLDIPFHRISTGLPSGPRVVINDRKPDAMFTSQALSLEIARNEGIGHLELPHSEAPTPLQRFEGGSFAETLLLDVGGKKVVRKRASKRANLATGYTRLKNQYRTLMRFSQICPELTPKLFSEVDNFHEYFYDMEFLSSSVPLNESAPDELTESLSALLERFNRYVYCHQNRYRPLAQEWLQKHLEDKIFTKIDALSANERLRPLLVGDSIEIDGVNYPSVQGLLNRITGKTAFNAFVPEFLSIVHGDLTFQNIMRDAGGEVKVIDMESTDSPDAVELDLGKLLQSIYSQYDTWSLAKYDLCKVEGEARIALNFAPKEPDQDLLACVQAQWSDILGCSRDLVELKGSFFLGLHLLRMIPFRLKVSEDQAVYAAATAIQWLNHSVELAQAA